MTSPKDTPMSETEVTQAEIIAFLRGEGPLEGKHFGDKDERGRAFWWRRHLDRITHTTPSDVALRWEGEWLRLGAETVGCVGSVDELWRWRCGITGESDWARDAAHARTAAEQAVRDWLKRAGLV